MALSNITPISEEKSVEAGLAMILNCDPYYKRHLQKEPESKHKTSAPEIEEELKTAFELYSKVCASFTIIFLHCVHLICRTFSIVTLQIFTCNV